LFSRDLLTKTGSRFLSPRSSKREGTIAMYCLVLVRDRPNALAERLAHRQQHIDYWNALGPTVKVAGAMLSSDLADATPIGSSFLLEAANLDAARALIAQDPFALLGIFGEDMVIQPVRPAIGVWKPD
jgi:hypothetical protein